MAMNTHPIISNQTTTLAEHTAVSTGSTFKLPALYTTFQASAADNGGTITAATVLIEASNDEVTWVTLGTLSVTTDGTSDGFSSNAAWKFVRSRTIAPFTEAGSTPTVTVTMGY